MLTKKAISIMITLKRLLKDNGRSFVSLMHANNEIGTLSDIEPHR